MLCACCVLSASLQTAAAEMAENHVEDEFLVVHAVTEPDGTVQHEAVESLDEKLLAAVRASNQDDVKALLKEGATLHELAEATDLSFEMKTLVGESLAALYSAECTSLTGYLAYRGSFLYRGAPIAVLTQRCYQLSLVHADGSLSSWRSSADRGSLQASLSFTLVKATAFYEAHAQVVSMCVSSGESYGLDNAEQPDVATCSRTGLITVWSKAGAALKKITGRDIRVDNIETIPLPYSFGVLLGLGEQFAIVGTSLSSEIIHLWHLTRDAHATINTGEQYCFMQLNAHCIDVCCTQVYIG
jgi:hypothetical protein